MVEKFISSLSDDEEAKDKKASRGPFLAHIELYKQIHDRECTDTREGNSSTILYMCSTIKLSHIYVIYQYNLPSVLRLSIIVFFQPAVCT